MILDPHIHSIYSGDSRQTPAQIVKRSRQIGLDVIAIADHNTLKGSEEALDLTRNLDDILVIPAMEVSTSKGHILALGITDKVQKKRSPEETIEEVRSQGGIAIVPHPFVRYREGLCDYVIDLDMDAIETLNSRYIFGYSNWRAKKLALKRGIPQVGSSDAHFTGAIGSCVTELEAEKTTESVIKGILSGKTKTYGDRTPLSLIMKEVIRKKIINKF
ncbi:MAG: PHP domain-containing protein [Methanobacterium sp.]|jgi:predicted metal-dependent phosphoesterase TrpH|nr:PHP domain-containing protein [Methanobacterium sp.]